MGSCLSLEEQKKAAGSPHQVDQRIDPCRQNSISLLPPPKGVEDLRVIAGYGNVNTFTYSQLSAATKNFRPDQILGHGGFGIVYRGILDENIKRGFKSTQVAVKKLNPEGVQGDKEWLAEVNYLGQLSHPNLVKLIGYCCEGDHRLLVYEYMACGSLERHLFRRVCLTMPWPTRIKIALGAAKGLAFLHAAERPIIYRDFKTSNILLDADYNAKLSDFGLAKEGPMGDETHVSTQVVGTEGYAAPEYVATDPRMEGQYSRKAAMAVAGLVHRCLSQLPKGRPAMNQVVETLESIQELPECTEDTLLQSGGNSLILFEAPKVDNNTIDNSSTKKEAENKSKMHDRRRTKHGNGRSKGETPMLTANSATAPTATASPAHTTFGPSSAARPPTVSSTSATPSLLCPAATDATPAANISTPSIAAASLTESTIRDHLTHAAYTGGAPREERLGMEAAASSVGGAHRRIQPARARA
ncbi:STYKc [Musa troglodytarum]|uniref:non-specific serine/threonine protein kinase n=1 Tax=Musa troglodytarum TaxID=320322 RepID=A0A9E7KJE8_9LILI|nr:STYKc [Musa troglodytarum]